MKPRHQIIFDRRRPGSPVRKKGPVTVNLDSKTDAEATSKVDIVRSSVTVGERELKFARALSDTEKHVREASLRSLRTWLSENVDAMNETEMGRLWKGLFYCIWMADKREVISTVIGNIVDLADIAGWPFLNALFSCLMREWFGIDRHRVDKYYELVNSALSKCIIKSKIDIASSFEELLEGLDTLLDTLCERVWEASRKEGVGLALHILDGYMDKILKPVLTLAAKNGIGCGSSRIAIIYDKLMEDIFTMIGARKGWLPSLSKRIQGRIINRLVELVQDEEIGLSKVMQRIIVDKTAKALFKIASEKATEDGLRKELYEYHLKLKVFVHECENAEDEEKTSDKNENKDFKEVTDDAQLDKTSDTRKEDKQKGNKSEQKDEKPRVFTRPPKKQSKHKRAKASDRGEKREAEIEPAAPPLRPKKTKLRKMGLVPQ